MGRDEQIYLSQKDRDELRDIAESFDREGSHDTAAWLRELADCKGGEEDAKGAEASMKTEFSASFAALYPDGTEGDRIYAPPADSVAGALANLAAAIDGYGSLPSGLPVEAVDGEWVVPCALDMTLTWKQVEDAKGGEG